VRDQAAAAIARERYGCLNPWRGEPADYGRAVLTKDYRRCEEEVVAQCRELLQRRLAYSGGDVESFFDAAQNARLIAAAERYYRAMYYGGPQSWNLRDRHMCETLAHLLDAHGAEAKAVVWAHNSHIGDARHTDLGEVHGELSLGQLCRERWGDDVALIGFGTHSGEVAAASHWDGEMKIETIRPSHRDSYERLCHEAGLPQFLLDLRRDERVRERLLSPRLERMIGVIYRPQTELASHYVRASLPQQFDAYLWFDQTSPVTPLGGPAAESRAPETYPFGL